MSKAESGEKANVNHAAHIHTHTHGNDDEDASKPNKTAMKHEHVNEQNVYCMYILCNVWNHFDSRRLAHMLYMYYSTPKRTSIETLAILNTWFCMRVCFRHTCASLCRMAVMLLLVDVIFLSNFIATTEMTTATTAAANNQSNVSEKGSYTRALPKREKTVGKKPV